MSKMYPDYDIKIMVRNGKVTIINYDNLARQEAFEYMRHKDVVDIVKKHMRQALRYLK